MFTDITSTKHMISLNSDSIMNVDGFKGRNLVGPLIISENSNLTITSSTFRGLNNYVT